MVEIKLACHRWLYESLGVLGRKVHGFLYETWVLSRIVPLTGCITLEQFFDLADPQFLISLEGADVTVK